MFKENEKAILKETIDRLATANELNGADICCEGMTIVFEGCSES